MKLDSNDLKAAQQVREIYGELKRDRDPFMMRCKEVLDNYNGDIAIPLPELSTVEKPAVANLIALGIDQTAMSIASVVPSPEFPVLGNTDAANKRADDSRRVVYGWWDMNAMNLKDRRRARHLVSYGETVVSLSPAPDSYRDQRNIPFWRVRNPLSTFSAPSTNPDDMERDFVIFHNQRPVSWFQRNYPGKIGQLFQGEISPVAEFSVLEFINDEETLLVGIGAAKMGADKYGRDTPVVETAVILERTSHNFGFCPVVVAGRLTLDRIEGQFYQALGIEHRRAMLDSLNTIAVFRNIFPDEWAVSNSNSPTSARIVKRANGKMGEIGLIDKGQLQVVRPPLNQEIGLTLDRYEAATRQFGVPAQFSGENPSNVRTARASNELIGAMVDMNLQESQELLAGSKEIELYMAINIMKKMWGSKPSSFYFGRDGKIPHDDYVPNTTLVSDLPRVRYPLPGRDPNGMAVAFGQKHGIGEMSLKTIRELDPDIKDPLVEGQRVEVENLERALWTALEQGASQGTMDPTVIARIAKKVQQGTNGIDAVVAVDAEMQKEQAAQADQNQADVESPQATNANPANQPGMSNAPSAPVVGGTPAAPSGPPSLQDLLGRLTGTPPEVQPNAVAQAPATAPAGV